jgi:hypothetical protein
MKMFFERMVLNSATDCSKLVQVLSKDCSCTEGKRWSNTMLIKKCVEYLQCFHHFVQPLYMWNVYHFTVTLLMNWKIWVQEWKINTSEKDTLSSSQFVSPEFPNLLTWSATLTMIKTVSSTKSWMSAVVSVQRRFCTVFRREPLTKTFTYKW